MDTYKEQWLHRKARYSDLTAMQILIEEETRRKYINLTQKWDIALTLSVFSTTASGVSMNLLPLTMPALLIRMVTSPISLFT